MKKWQEERNYRRIYNEAGEAIANIITVDGVDVEVAEDVYLAYSQADRRERYVREEQFSGKILSLEQMAEDDLLSDYVGAEAAPSAEEEALEREQAQSLAERKEMLLLAMLSLNDADRELINALFFDKEIPHCSLKSAYQQYGQPPGRMSVRAVCAMTRRRYLRRAIKPVTGRLWQSRLALTLFGLIMRHKALASMMRLGCPGVESSRDPRNTPVRR